MELLTKLIIIEVSKLLTGLTRIVIADSKIDILNNDYVLIVDVFYKNTFFKIIKKISHYHLTIADYKYLYKLAKNIAREIFEKVKEIGIDEISEYNEIYNKTLEDYKNALETINKEIKI